MVIDCKECLAEIHLSRTGPNSERWSVAGVACEHMITKLKLTIMSATIDHVHKAAAR